MNKLSFLYFYTLRTTFPSLQKKSHCTLTDCCNIDIWFLGSVVASPNVLVISVQNETGELCNLQQSSLLSLRDIYLATLYLLRPLFGIMVYSSHSGGQPVASLFPGHSGMTHGQSSCNYDAALGLIKVKIPCS